MSKTTAATQAAPKSPKAAKGSSNGTPKAPKLAASPKDEANGAAEKKGLRKPQARILQALSKTKESLTRKQIADKAKVDIAGCVEWIGSDDADRRAANDAKHFPSLITLGLVKIGTDTEEGATTYFITANGRKAAEKVAKE